MSWHQKSCTEYGKGVDRKISSSNAVFPPIFLLALLSWDDLPKNPEYIGSLVGSWLWLYDWPLCLSTRRDSLLLHCPPNTEHFHAQFTTSRIPKKAVFLLALNFISTTFFKDTHFPDGHQEKILYSHTCSKMVKVGSFECTSHKKE